MTDTYGSPLFAALREARAAEWEAYVAHDFVTRLGDGTLPREAFLTYLRQDYLFLVHFARAWALAAAKTDRIEEMRACAGTLHALQLPKGLVNQTARLRQIVRREATHHCV